MAINLKKEAYQNKQPPAQNDFSAVSGDREIYPTREIYPKAPPKTAAEEKLPRKAAKPAKSRKKHVIIYAVTAIVLIVGGAALKRSSDSRSEADNGEYQLVQYVHSSENVEEIVINGGNTALSVEYADEGSDIVLSAYSCNEVTMSDSSAVLEIGYIPKSADDAEEYLNNYMDYGGSTLTLPRDFDGKVSLTGGDNELFTSSISCLRQTKTGTIDLYCENGDVSLYMVTADNIRLSSGYGTVWAETLTADTLEAYSEHKGIQLNMVTAEKSTRLSGGTALSSLNMRDTYLKGSTVIESKGCIYGEDLKFEGDTSMQTENYVIDLKNIGFENLTLKNSNADITVTSSGSLSDYAVTAQTDGKCNIPSGGNGRYALDVTNSGGDINISFSE